jgi:hypothetical protein
MEAILMKGVKGLDERATAALARKADAGALQVSRRRPTDAMRRIFQSEHAIPLHDAWSGAALSASKPRKIDQRRKNCG